MNREIRFRGKPVDKQFGKWIEGYYLKDLDGGQVKHYIFNCPMQIEVDLETVGQFTGLCDKHGNKIFQGDILNICNTSIGEVAYYDAKSGFAFEPKNSCMADYLGCYDNEYMEIIGNIYDNLSLLK